MENFLNFQKNINPDDQQIAEIIIKGIPSSPGVAIGQAAIIEAEKIVLPNERIPFEDIPDEIAKFEAAINEMTQEFIRVMNKVGEDDMNVKTVLETNLFIISDSVFTDSIKKRIKGGMSVENAVIQEFEMQITFFKRSNDILLRDRALDLQHIMERLLAVLRNRCVYFAVNQGQIVVAQSITPEDVVNFNDSGIAAIVTEVGGISSHSSILARSFDIPSVLGIKNATQIIGHYSQIVVDGYSGTVIINPSEQTIEKYEKQKEFDNNYQKELGKLIKVTAATIDKRRIRTQAIVGFPEDVDAAAKAGAEGVGLVRSENILNFRDDFPDEYEQTEWYSEIADRAYPSEVIIRAFDVGSDKFAPGIPRHESNPALGFRGIRFLLQRNDVFLTQIKAVLRASKYKNVKFMLPMVANLREITQSKILIEKAKEILKQENQDFDQKMPFGIMIETPAAVILAERFAEECDFFSIGTNDLTQYALAADRTNEMVNEYYDDFHPAIIRMLKMVLDAAKKRKIPVSICGEIAGHAAATNLLIGLGFSDLSVSPPSILELKKRILEVNFKKAEKFARQVLKCSSHSEVRDLIES